MTYNKPYIFVDTGFKRTTQPIFALAFMESHRRIPVSPEINQMVIEQRNPKIQSIIQQHYQDTAGELDLWGEILCYKYFITDSDALVFDVDGTVLSGIEGYAPTPATLTLNGKDLTKVIRC